MQKITPFLWFNDNAEEAMNFYVSVFKNGKIKTKSIRRYDKETAKVSGRPEGSFMTASFEIDGQEFMVINGGPEFKFSLATSFYIRCTDQKEVDYFWDKLGEGGKHLPCGWVTDKFGVTWQVVPTILDKMFNDSDPMKSERVMKALMEMKKLDIAKLKKAYDQK